MIKYSTNPSKDAKAITNSPTSPIVTKRDENAEKDDTLDLRVEDDNL